MEDRIIEELPILIEVIYPWVVQWLESLRSKIITANMESGKDKIKLLEDVIL